MQNLNKTKSKSKKKKKNINPRVKWWLPGAGW